MKVLHIADLHFGKKIKKAENIRKEIYKAQKQSFKDVIDYSINKNIQVILIAGDFFDGENRPLKLEKFILDEFNKLNNFNIKVFYCLGNHDSSNTFTKSFLSQLPENVKIFQDKFESVLLKDNIYIHSYGHKNILEEKNLISNFNKPVNDSINIGLLHCSVDYNDNIYFPTSLQDLINKSYDYWALGHIHKRQKLSKNIYYSGCLQGTSFNDKGKKGANLININDKEIDINFIEFSKIDFIEKNIKIDKNINKYNLLKKIKEKFNMNKKTYLIKINFIGNINILKSEFKEITLEIKDTLIQSENILNIYFKYEKINFNFDYKKYVNDNNILGYIDKLFKKPREIEKLIIENDLNIDKTLDEIKEEIFDEMVVVNND
ncbi:MAG: metallophosphoesterase family protein [Bacillota bacterium]